MAQLDIRRNYATGEVLLQQDLDAIVDDLETFLNYTKLNDDNIQDASITASTKVEAASINGPKFKNNAITTAKLASDSVTTDSIYDAAVTTAKLATDSVNTDQLAASAVTTSKFDASAITAAKMSSNYATSHTIGQVGGSSGDTVSATITTSGRPVMIFLQPGATAGGGGRIVTYARTSMSSDEGLSFKRDATLISYGSTNTYSGTAADQPTLPCGMMFCIDFPAAGTYTYSLAKGSYANFYNCNLVVIEI